MDDLKFKHYAYKGHWKVLLNDKVIGYVASPWTTMPYRKLNLDGSWSVETYKNRKLAAAAIIQDICMQFYQQDERTPTTLPS